jgi:hypothetical protein
MSEKIELTSDFEARICRDELMARDARIEALEAEVERLREALGEEEPLTDEEMREFRDALLRTMRSPEVFGAVMKHNALLRRFLKEPRRVMP